MADHLLLDFFNKNSKDEKACLEKITELKLDTVIRLKSSSSDFAKLCNNSYLNNHWQTLWTAYGFLLTHVHKVFLPQNLKYFDLVVGAFFFEKALTAKYQTGLDFSIKECSFLKEAIKYQSVHAIQRYNQSLYLQITTTEKKEVRNFFLKRL